MSKRRDSPALFEILRSKDVKRPRGHPRGASAGSAADGAGDAPDDRRGLEPPADDHDAALANPGQGASAPGGGLVEEPAGLGRTIRIPLGYVVLAIGALIVLLVIAYSVGFARGRADQASSGPRGEAAGLQGSTEEAAGNASGGAFNGSREAGAGRSGGSRLDPAGRSGSGEFDRTRERTFGGRSVPRTRDTRVEGLNYIIVEQFDSEEANGVADFLAEHGIDVMVLPAKNETLRQVVVRQGYEGWISNPDARRMLDRIKRLGLEWKSQHDGSKNFDRAYGAKFTG